MKFRAYFIELMTMEEIFIFFWGGIALATVILVLLGFWMYEKVQKKKKFKTEKETTLAAVDKFATQS